MFRVLVSTSKGPILELIKSVRVENAEDNEFGIIGIRMSPAFGGGDLVMAVYNDTDVKKCLETLCKDGYGDWCYNRAARMREDDGSLVLDDADVDNINKWNGNMFHRKGSVQGSQPVSSFGTVETFEFEEE